MNVLDVIDKKRIKEELSYSELSYIFNGYLNKEVLDYQMSSFLMAITINGLTDNEILDLTKIFVESGEVLEFPNDMVVDKHSTGGVGDKVTIILGPILAANGLLFPKMSGRGLGYTGGTADKLESIPGFKVDLSISEIYDQIKNIGVVLCTQNKNIVPLDKVIYDLRNSTCTVKSLPLIAVSIMSKKIACGAKTILIDIKCGDGALINTEKEAHELERLIKLISDHFNLNTIIEITNMDTPLGNNIGNALEIVEAIDILRGKKGYLTDLVISFAAKIIANTKNISFEDAEELAIGSINNGMAYLKFLDIVEYQGGDIDNIKLCDNIIPIKSPKTGIIKKIDALEIAKLAFYLGSGRLTKEQSIDYGVGIVLCKSVGDKINIDEPIMKLYTSKEVIINFDDIFEIV